MRIGAGGGGLPGGRGGRAVDAVGGARSRKPTERRGETYAISFPLMAQKNAPGAF
jgi:hypothetical protein